MPIEFLREYGKYLMITGVRDTRIPHPELVLQQLRQIDEKIAVQILDAKGLAGMDHLRFAVLNALKAHSQGSQVTGSVAIEILLYASGQRQIKNAIAYLGVSPDSRHIALIGIASEESPLENLRTQLPKIIEGKFDESVLEEGDNATIRRVFGITGDEMKTMLRRNTTEKEAITRLVIEKMALLSTQA